MVSLNEYIERSKKLIPKPGKPIKLALLSNFTIKWFEEVLRVLCSEHSIAAEVYTGGYNQYAQELINQDSKLHNFDPDMVFLLLDTDKFLGEQYQFPYRLNPAQRKTLIETEFNGLKKLFSKTGSIIIVNSFLIPSFSPMGILESKQEFGLKESIEYLNKLLRDYAKQNPKLFVYDFSSFAAKHGHKARASKLDFMADMKLDPELVPALCKEYMGYILPVASKSKKCLVLDLDNTLWGGIIGEDGLEGIKLGPEKEGLPFLEFQKRILALFERGVILAINSKNNSEDALNAIRNHPYMVLKEEHFASMRINWNDKVSNMKEIAKEINIGLDTLVFLDDDKLNRSLIREMLPEVTVVDLPEDVSKYPELIEELNQFNSLQITKEDLNKGKLYAQQRKRNVFEKSSSNIEDFINKLNMEIKVSRANKFNIPRISQLTQKTNQFNMTTKRYLEEQIKELANSEDHLVLCCDVKDRFGDNGITGVIIIEKQKSAWLIDTFLLSCRIIGRQVEDTLINYLLRLARQSGVKTLKAQFIPTKKNAPASQFYKSFGFRLAEENSKMQLWELSTDTEPRFNKNLKLMEE